MKGIQTTILLAIVIALPAIAYMHPLNSAAIAVVFVIAATVSGIILGSITYIAKCINIHATNRSIVILSGVTSAAIVFSSLFYLVSDRYSSESNIPPPVSSIVQPPRDSSPIPAREFLYSHEEPNERYGAYGYLLFISRPTKETYARYEEVCKNYISHMEHLKEYPHIYSRRLMVTYWLLSGRLPKGALNDCATLIQFYDYARAKEIASAVGALSFNGPVLVAWKYPYIYSDGTYEDHAITFDMSRFSNEDISRATNIWLSIIVEPENGLRHDTVVFAEEFRNLLQRYGEDILAFIDKQS
ncbi:hypothetical protein C942_00261 [Photobacterium marinum]|uniref:Uncharacterized protein n=1 Tax=Photobacterium marinum TaxID=1056511 RepID=L8JI83_9GAMM|nr:hypothetical protein [Photobacterium marinum]ELR67953.1 hypothetical protein C942_00261 [Photobacterium marinum]